MKSSDSDKSNSPNWIAAGFICLLIGGTIAAKTLLLIDTDLEIKTKFRGQSWQVNLQSSRKYMTEIDKVIEREFSPIGVLLRKQSTQLLAQTNDLLAVRRDWCLPTPEISTILAQAKQLNPLESDRYTPSKTDRLKQPAHRHSPNQTTLTPHPLVNSDRAVSDWCFATGTKK
ncbi:hypothetical protein [Chamaesiphon sp.]|uniref:hypothetical protein n=1 Tax=Chamaesiphon sp. TaxID=2814140 RepID=UPI0035942C5B